MRLLEKVLYKLRAKKFVADYRKHCVKKTGHALLYYKTDPFILESIAHQYAHTNNWEILEIAKVLNRLGYWVDIVDRDIPESWMPEDKYDVFIGLGAGDSGKYFAKFGETLKKAIRVFYAAGPEPDLSNQLIHERYAYFSERNKGRSLDLRRLITRVDVKRAMAATDVIFCIGNVFDTDSYAKHNKPMYRIFPSSSPDITISVEELKSGDSRDFLYFGGNGNVVKGLDILIEVFSGLPDLHLHICGPQEPDFLREYGDLLARCKNIHWVGFVQVGGETFNQITSKCGFIILPSCSEGTATSVTTVMRKGLIPLVTYETGIDVEDFGFLLKDLSIDAMRKQVSEAASMPRPEFKRRRFLSYIDSLQYTQRNFSLSFEKALLKATLR